MFGYATNETDVLMPAPITYSHLLVKRHSEVRKNGTLSWLQLDAKSQITFRYEDGKPVAIDAVVLSTQHKEEISLKDLQEGVMEEIIKPVLPEAWINADTKYFINPTGRFVIGGPHGDCGLTGRKIIVDTYGGMARHGGGAGWAFPDHKRGGALSQAQAQYAGEDARLWRRSAIPQARPPCALSHRRSDRLVGYAQEGLDLRCLSRSHVSRSPFTRSI